MELNIGTNIKRLRIGKGLTQEQLADALSVSAAAVSKWEAKNTFPDITMLFPLARLFGVSVDELLGFDEAKAKSEAKEAIADYYAARRNGDFASATEILASAMVKHPYDYTVMNTYMWDKAGGSAGNRAEVLLEHRDEFSRICNSILNGCDDENIRLEALNMKAKLLHAEGDTEGALELISKIPSWAASSEQKREQLFAKNTLEYRYWNRRNCYAMLDGASIKLARTVRFDASLSVTDKVKRVEAMGDAVMTLCETEGLECLVILAQSLYSVIAGSLTADDCIADVIRLREKQFAAMEKMMQTAKNDKVLMESIERAYKTDDIVAWKVELLLNSPHPQFASLRESEEYLEMLSRWKNR